MSMLFWVSSVAAGIGAVICRQPSNPVANGSVLIDEADLYLPGDG